MQKTAGVVRQWHLLDAKNRILGEVATEAAQLLIGKQKPTYTPHIDGGDYVIVINAQQVAVTGNKRQDKMYYSHSSQPGGFRAEPFAHLQERAPEQIIIKAVRGMLPKNKLQDPRILRLKVFPAAEHTYQDKLGAQTE
jgi:large subunit ribosomal protein L13